MTNPLGWIGDLQKHVEATMAEIDGTKLVKVPVGIADALEAAGWLVRDSSGVLLLTTPEAHDAAE